VGNKVERLEAHDTVIDGWVPHFAPLTVGVSYDGAPPLIAEPDVLTSLVQIRCYCGAPVAVLWSNDRRARTGKPAVLFLQSQIIEDPAARPVKTRIVEDLVQPDATFVADCPAHGRQTIDGASLIKHGRAMQARIARGTEQMGKYVLPRVSRAPE